MNSKIAILVLAIIIIFSGISSPKVYCKTQPSPVTVTLTNGKVLTNVELTVDRSYSTLKVKDVTTGETQIVSFHEVSKIEDKDGNNITTKFLGSYSPPESTPEDKPSVQPSATNQEISDEPAAEATKIQANKPASEPWLSEESETAKKWKEKPWNVRFRAGALLEVPFGDWFEGLGADIGFEIAAEIMITHEASLRATFSYCGLKADETFFMPNLPGYSFGEPYIDFIIQRAMLWLVYSKQTSEKVTFFATGGIGAAMHNADIIIPVTDTTTMETENLPFTIDETEFTIGSGFGVVYWVADHIGIEFGVDFSMIHGTIDDIDGISYGYLFSPKMGITTAF